MGLSAVERTYH
jgi:hypothetical protein